MAKVAGMEGLKQSLESLKTNAARKALRYATRKAAVVVRDAAQANAPVGEIPHRTYKGRIVAPGFLSRSVGVAVNFARSGGFVRARIGPQREAFYGSQFVEIGTSQMPKRPWLVPAYIASRGEVERVFVNELRKAIDRAVKRGAVR